MGTQKSGFRLFGLLSGVKAIFLLVGLVRAPRAGLGSWKLTEENCSFWSWCPRKLAGRLASYLPCGPVSQSRSIASGFPFLLLFLSVSGTKHPATQHQEKHSLFPSQAKGSLSLELFSLSFMRESHSFQGDSLGLDFGPREENNSSGTLKRQSGV